MHSFNKTTNQQNKNLNNCYSHSATSYQDSVSKIQDKAEALSREILNLLKNTFNSY